MRIYKCESCERTTNCVYEISVKECSVTYDYDMDIFGNGYECPMPIKTKRKIHLCKDCFFGSRHTVKTKKR